VEYVKKSFADGAAAIKSKGDSGISDAVVDPFVCSLEASRSTLRRSEASRIF